MGPPDTSGGANIAVQSAVLFGTPALSRDLRSPLHKDWVQGTGISRRSGWAQPLGAPKSLRMEAMPCVKRHSGDGSGLRC
ncbi:hypothetical protein YTPLAS18_05200 [Nitrospira sp.]|nr:hypothetical protein YTPLAS18_05200 [Nitrospira sp.]